MPRTIKKKNTTVTPTGKKNPLHLDLYFLTPSACIPTSTLGIPRWSHVSSAPTETHSPLASEWSASPRQRTPGKSPPRHGTRWALRSPVAAKQSSSLNNAHILGWGSRRVAGHLNASSDLGYPRGDSQPAKTNARCSLPLLGSTSPCLS